ncbi:MAG: 4-alpha-glucanotransferase [Nitrosomonadales bacterium]|nr:4-alpha-glucanotransferase [Nitrosomonadales bacterium]
MPTLTERTSGILLHPTSLPGPLGAGDFGPDAYRFVDWLVSAGQTYWQMLPLGEIGPGNSPYMSSSAFAGNILLIDLAELANKGWLTDEELKPHPEFKPDRINFALLRPFRMERLRRAAKNFFAEPQKSGHQETSLAAYTEFCNSESEWLDDYAIFMTLNEQQNGCEWSRWPASLANRNPQALQHVTETCTEEIDFWNFCQWSFARQWAQLKQYAREQGIRVIGDVPIFAAYQSADVWAHQKLFELDENGRPTVVAGVPPDYFSKTGQLWGNPLYRWEAHEKTGFAWWIARMRHALKRFDLVRVDHFRGFAGYWEIPANETTAINGRWMPGPGAKLFEALDEALGGLPIIAEDLGMITPDVVELRERFNLPGMRILQFAFAEDENHPFLPHRYVPNSVAYTGTHDNDTSIGWWNTATPGEKEFAKKYLGTEGHHIQWDMIGSISKSEANTVIILMQDVLGLSGEYRMNFPGHPYENWEWRFSWEQVLPVQTQALARITAENGRSPLA